MFLILIYDIYYHFFLAEVKYIQEFLGMKDFLVYISHRYYLPISIVDYWSVD